MYRREAGRQAMKQSGLWEKGTHRTPMDASGWPVDGILVALLFQHLAANSSVQLCPNGSFIAPLDAHSLSDDHYSDYSAPGNDGYVVADDAVAATADSSFGNDCDISCSDLQNH